MIQGRPVSIFPPPTDEVGAALESWSMEKALAPLLLASRETTRKHMGLDAAGNPLDQYPDRCTDRLLTAIEQARDIAACGDDGCPSMLAERVYAAHNGTEGDLMSEGIPPHG